MVRAEISRESTLAEIAPYRYKQFLSTIVQAYDSRLIRTYCRVRFTIININILDMLTLCLRGKRRILDVGCGFGLFGCYLAARTPDLVYRGVDLSASRIETARSVAARLGLGNVSFTCADARDLDLREQYDAIMMLDLFHHIDDDAKHRLIETCTRHLAPGGRLVIKDVTTHPWPKLAFTWALDVILTRGLGMWYWNEQAFGQALGKYFGQIDTFPITDWLPYPHMIYLCEDVIRPV